MTRRLPGVASGLAFLVRRGCPGQGEDSGRLCGLGCGGGRSLRVRRTRSTPAFGVVWVSVGGWGLLGWRRRCRWVGVGCGRWFLRGGRCCVPQHREWSGCREPLEPVAAQCPL